MSHVSINNMIFIFEHHIDLVDHDPDWKASVSGFKSRKGQFLFGEHKHSYLRHEVITCTWVFMRDAPFKHCLVHRNTRKLISCLETIKQLIYSLAHIYIETIYFSLVHFKSNFILPRIYFPRQKYAQKRENVYAIWIHSKNSILPKMFKPYRLQTYIAV